MRWQPCLVVVYAMLEMAADSGSLVPHHTQAEGRHPDIEINATIIISLNAENNLSYRQSLHLLEHLPTSIV